MYGLNIHLTNLSLDSSIIHPIDRIRISVTTIPEENKQAFVVEAKKIKDIDHFFTVNITKKTKKIIIVFRKKSIMKEDPIIASTIIHNDQFPKMQFDTKNSEVKQVPIYEPFTNGHNKDKEKENRPIVGHMQIQLTAGKAFPEQTCTKDNNKINKMCKCEEHSKANTLNNNENSSDGNILVLIN